MYDSDTVHFYLDGVRSTDESDHGDLVARATDVVIGQAGEGSDHEYFTGIIDEVKLFGAFKLVHLLSTMPLWENRFFHRIVILLEQKLLGCERASSCA